MFSKKIPDKKWVKACIANYVVKYSTCRDVEIMSTYTESVQYDLELLKKWLNNDLAQTNCDNIKVEFGVYKGNTFSGATSDDVAKIKDNRLTVFLVPYCGKNRATITKEYENFLLDTEADAFDLGQLEPPLTDGSKK